MSKKRLSDLKKRIGEHVPMLLFIGYCAAYIIAYNLPIPMVLIITQALRGAILLTVSWILTKKIDEWYEWLFVFLVQIGSLIHFVECGTVILVVFFSA